MSIIHLKDSPDGYYLFGELKLQKFKHNISSGMLNIDKNIINSQKIHLKIISRCKIYTKSVK